MQVIWSSTFYSIKYFFSLTKAVIFFLDHMTFIVITLPVLKRWRLCNFHPVMRQRLFYKNKSANTVMDLQLRAHPLFHFSSGSLCISSEIFNIPLASSSLPLTLCGFWLNMCSTLSIWYLNPIAQCSYTTILLKLCLPATHCSLFYQKDVMAVLKLPPTKPQLFLGPATAGSII